MPQTLSETYSSSSPTSGPKTRPPLTREEMEESLSRLYDQPLGKIKKRYEEYEVDIEAKVKKGIAHPTALGELSASESRMIEGLYSQSMKKKTLSIEQLRQKYDYPLPSMPKKSADETEEILDRLYSKSMQHQKQAMKAAEEKLYGKPPPRKGLSPDALETSVTKLYKEAVNTRKDNLMKMDEEYSFKPPTMKRMPQTELDALVVRLASKNG